MKPAMNACELKESSGAKLITDVTAVVADAKAYLDASVGQTGEAYAAARMKLQKTVDAATAQAIQVRQALAEKTRAAARATDTYVHQNPWEVVAIGAGLGLLVGWWATRR
jgi:ElaB/YqjD/DUF883 family membrane-anchored ribosome-binding protein